MPDGQVSLDPKSLAPTLERLDSPLGRFTGSNESVFLGIGHILGTSVESFGRMGAEFAGLAGELHSHEAGSAATALQQASQVISQMSVDRLRASFTMLAQLEAGAAVVEKQLGTLHSIIGEIGALAINGKIQAALVTAGGIDFSVFTKEIGRLGQLAEASTAQASGRMREVRGAVASALAAAAAFEQGEAKELEAVRGRVGASIEAMTLRRRTVADAADSVSSRSQDIAQRITQTVGELQINDNVNQRIEHVRDALRALGQGRAFPQLDAGRQASAAAGLLRLAIAQLEHGTQDYGSEVASLVRNLTGLAEDARNILSDAEGAFGGGSGGVFVDEIEADIRRAAELLAVFSEGRDRTRAVVQQVSAAIAAMSDDLESIRSIDADLRIMGLNATLKCGRLGNEGRALGVVSHELRVCSKRTEDSSHIIAEQLEKLMALSQQIASGADGESGDGDPGQMLSETLSALSSMGQVLEQALGTLRTECGGVAGELFSAAKGVTIHHELESVCRDSIRGLAAQLSGLEPVPPLDREGHQAIYDLIYASYTMNRERFVHKDFAAGYLEITIEEQAAPTADDGLDDLFL